MTKVEALLAQIGDPEDDSTPAYDLVAELSEEDQALVPELKRALWNFLKTQNFHTIKSQAFQLLSALGTTFTVDLFLPTQQPNPSYFGQEEFTQVGQALWMLFLSWLGGTVAFLLFRSRERTSSTPATTAP